MGLLDTELAKWKRAFGLISGIPKTLKNNPANAATADAMFGLLGGVPGLGDYVSGAEAKYRYDQGDILGAGLAGLGALPAVPNVAGMFIGKGAKTWDALKAAEAEKLLAKGVDPKEVWKQNGTFKGVDNALRQEIPDNAAEMESGGKYFGTKGGGGKASQVLEHDDLYRAYPEAGNINTNYNFEAPTHGGSFNEASNFIQVDAPMGYQSAKSTTLHELQHAIQQREGWAKGGNTESMPDEISTNQAKVIAAMIKKGKTPSESIKWVREKLGWWPDAKTIDMAMSKDIGKYGDTPMESYRRLAGEAEARATQARMNMDMPQRLENYPLDSYDVPLDQLIVRYDNGVANSQPTGLLSYADEAKKDNILETDYIKSLNDDPHAVYGLRVIPHGYEVKTGDYLDNSKKWVDGEITDENLPGVSTIGIEKGDISKAINQLIKAGYSGKQIALVKGDSAGYGDDVYERLIKNAEVVSEIPKSIIENKTKTGLLK